MARSKPLPLSQDRTPAAYFSGLPHPLRDLALRLRAIILRADLGILESLMWGKPWYGKGPGLANAVCYIMAQANHVNLGFSKGTSLSDPDGVLEGTGKGMRHVKIRSAVDIQPKLFAAWVREGIALNVHSGGGRSRRAGVKGGRKR